MAEFGPLNLGDLEDSLDSFICVAEVVVIRGFGKVAWDSVYLMRLVIFYPFFFSI